MLISMKVEGGAAIPSPRDGFYIHILVERRDLKSIFVSSLFCKPVSALRKFRVESPYYCD
jgi:hypothetical protein